MFRWANFTFCTLILLASFLVYWYDIRLQPNDPHAYFQLIQTTEELRSNQLSEPAVQTRHGVQKDIYAYLNDERTHFCLKSDHSTLTLTPNKGKMSAIEKLNDLTCSMHKEIDHPDLYTLKAQNGLYQYPTHQFTAHQIDITVSKDQNAPHFIGSAEQLNFKPHKPLELTGDVKLFSTLQGKETFALADSLSYLLDDKKLTLSAEQPKKVLFWQNGLQLSANQLLLAQDPFTNKEMIKGYGDVRFTLDENEQKTIEQLFLKYL